MDTRKKNKSKQWPWGRKTLRPGVRGSAGIRRRNRAG